MARVCCALIRKTVTAPQPRLLFLLPSPPFLRSPRHQVCNGMHHALLKPNPVLCRSSPSRPSFPRSPLSPPFPPSGPAFPFNASRPPFPPPPSFLSPLFPPPLPPPSCRARRATESEQRRVPRAGQEGLNNGVYHVLAKRALAEGVHALVFCVYRDAIALLALLPAAALAESDGCEKSSGCRQGEESVCERHAGKEGREKRGVPAPSYVTQAAPPLLSTRPHRYPGQPAAVPAGAQPHRPYHSSGAAAVHPRLHAPPRAAPRVTLSIPLPHFLPPTLPCPPCSVHLPPSPFPLPPSCSANLLPPIPSLQAQLRPAPCSLALLNLQQRISHSSVFLTAAYFSQQRISHSSVFLTAAYFSQQRISCGSHGTALHPVLLTRLRVHLESDCWTAPCAEPCSLDSLNLQHWRDQVRLVGLALCVGGAVLMAVFRGPLLLGEGGEQQQGDTALLQQQAALPPGAEGAGAAGGAGGGGGGVGGGGGEWVAPGSVGAWSMGVMSLVGNCMSMAAYLTIQVPVLRRFPAPVTVTAMAYVVGALLMLLIALLSSPPSWVITGWPLVAVVFAGVVTSALNYALMTAANRRVGPATVALYNPLQPVASATLSYLCLASPIFLGSLSLQGTEAALQAVQQGDEPQEPLQSRAEAMVLARIRGQEARVREAMEVINGKYGANTATFLNDDCSYAHARTRTWPTEHARICLFIHPARPAVLCISTLLARPPSLPALSLPALSLPALSPPCRETFPSGALTLDIALGGGLPKGRIVEIYGQESSGKTTLALHAIAQVQKRGGIAWVVDAEHALDLKYARQLGVHTDKLVLCQAEEADKALEIVDTAMRGLAADIVVVDSVPALIPSQELESEMGQESIGLLARLMSKVLKKLSASASRSKCTVVFLNQMRQKINTGGFAFGSPETTTGGNALRYFASVRLDLRSVGKIKSAKDESDMGIRVRCKVAKSKVSPPLRTAEFDLLFGTGISHAGCVLDCAEELKKVERKGSWYSFRDEMRVQGRENAITFLNNNPHVLCCRTARPRPPPRLPSRPPTFFNLPGPTSRFSPIPLYPPSWCSCAVQLVREHVAPVEEEVVSDEESDLDPLPFSDDDTYHGADIDMQ
ncbi:unnamed protein product [Closterium sp. Naga37s-1]|nr:unnamed protein product [Closterium sp. Naga37s-1]